MPAVYVFLLRPTDGSVQVLLQLRQGTGYRDGHWAAAAAGHVERGETVHQAAHREAAEELGIHDLTLRPWCTMQRTNGTGLAVDERVDYFFTCVRWSGTPAVLEPTKSAGLGWYDLTDLPVPVVPHEAQVLDTIRAGSTEPIVTHGF